MVTEIKLEQPSSVLGEGARLQPGKRIELTVDNWTYMIRCSKKDKHTDIYRTNQNAGVDEEPQELARIRKGDEPYHLTIKGETMLISHI